MKRAERHHLKQDEFVNWLDETMSWLSDNQRNIVNGTLVIVGAGLLLGGLYIYRVRQAERAKALLSSALEQYHGVVVSGTGAEPPPGVPTFATAEERYRSSLESLEPIAEEFGSYDAGRHARYYVGLSHMGLSEFDAAEEAFEAVRSGDRDLLYYLASRALAAVKLERGDPPAAAEIYRALVDDASNPLPRDYLLFELARQYYARVLAEHPESQLRGDAMTRSEILELSRESDADSSD